MNIKGKYIYDWPRPMVTVDATIFTHSGGKIRVLLIKRGREPFKGKWAVPGGFVNMDEELEDAVVRELAEETGVTGVHLEQMHTFGTVGRDPRGRQITIVFMGIAAEDQTKVKAGDDAAEAQWFDIEELPEDLAFDHDEVIRFAVGKFKQQFITKFMDTITSISNDQLEKSFVFVLSKIDVYGTLPIEVAPNHFFQRASSLHIKKIKGLINLCKPSLKPYPLPILYELDVIKESGDKPDSFRYQHILLPENKWRYWVITFEGTNSEINYIETAISLLRNDLELGFTVFGKSSLAAGEGYIWHGQSLFSFFDSGEEKRQAKVVTGDELREIRENYNLVKEIKPHFEHIIRALRKFNQLKSLPRNSELIVIGLFSIIESLITHNPSNKNIDDSLTHQIKTKIPLLSKRFDRKLDYDKYFPSEKEDTIWAKLYKYRSKLVHGEHSDIDNTLQILKDRENVMEFLKETTKLLLLISLREPILLTDLKKC